jgi:hypothetical protein
VDYVAIGGVAVQAHGYPRTTQDVDILVAPECENLTRLSRALAELEARIGGVAGHLVGIDPRTPEALAEGARFLLATRVGPVDVWTDPAELPGAAPWHDLRARAVEATVAGGIMVRAVGRDDLIALKRAAAPNRPTAAKREQDLADIALLAGQDRGDSGESRAAGDRDTSLERHEPSGRRPPDHGRER